MFKKIFYLTIFAIGAFSNRLSAEIEYDINDIGTLQTKSSEAIALNNQGQILGWYNVDGSSNGKQFFVRDRSGVFYEVSSKEQATGYIINWRFLTDDGKAYGTYDGNASFSIVYVWDQKNGVVKLGNLPNREIVTVKNNGKILIKSIVENENGKSVRRPIIWQNGLIIKLKGLAGNLGIESDESYGFDMNNNGDVVGQSTVYLNYKNELYKQVHAVKWVNGKAVDLHKEIPKTNISCAEAINDNGDIIIGGYLVRKDGQSFVIGKGCRKITANNYLYNDMYVLNKECNIITTGYAVSNKMLYDIESMWMSFKDIISVNDDGEVIARGVTIYGEEHSMLLTPVKPK